LSPSANSNNVPILDLKAQYEQVGEKLEELVLNVLRSGHYVLGKLGQTLEEEMAALCGTKYGVGVANGTDALVLALWAADIGPGDEVITPSFTFAATAEAIGLRGATPKFIEVDPVTYNINPAQIEALITRRTKAIIPVHLYGQPADMDPIMEIADRYNLTVIEDNAQAISATYKGKPTGSFGDMACISFYPTKNLGAAGDAGMIVTKHEKYNERLRALRAHGSKVRYYHDELGVNSRLDEVQAAVLLSKLPHLAQWNAKRNQVAQWYQQAFKNSAGIITPAIAPDCTHVWHQYTIRVTVQQNPGDTTLVRDQLIKELGERGISSMCYYPVPLHMQKAFSSYGYKKGDLQLSETLADQVISLPMYPELREDQVKQVAAAVTEIVSAKLAAAPVATPVVTGF
jgi:dTDP-4-amino-4,6-dideoxygalactose transaminase